jgi:phage gp36-like protein
MSYASRADLVARWGEQWLGQRESMLPAGATDIALADASAEIDGYLRARYTLPLASVPADLKRLACDIARYRLLDDAAGRDSTARLAYEDAVKQLSAIRDGKSALVGSDGANADGSIDTGGIGLARVKPARRRVFG